MSAVPYPASLWRRLAAAVYDLFLLVALLFAATAIALPLYGQAVPTGTFWYRLYILLVPMFFLGWFWTHGGQTLGMRAWRLQLRDAESGEPIRWSRVPLRYLAAALAWASLIGVLYSLFDRQNRGLHDIVCGTEIVVLPKIKYAA